uniref:G-protein coupled receptors family 1 profile domain-containing protein n=1 Tax=Electrophorus electricus TaxID=8005 RepID=A0A4W4HRG6_ELEEL
LAGPWDPGYLGPPSVTNSAVKMVLIAAIVCASLFGNVVVLLAFQRKPQLLHVANRFVLNLLLADLLQTVLVMPFAIAAAAPGVWPLDARLCRVLVVLMHLFAFAGVNTIIVVSVDRYLAIIHPLSYPTRMTPHLGTNLIALTWLLGVLQSTPPLYGWGAIDFDRRHSACTVVWSASYSYSALVAALSFWLPVAIMLGPFSAAYPTRNRHRRFHYHCKAARVVFVVMASYILSMGPYSVLSTVSMRPGAAVPPWLASLSLVLFFLQCCLHPYIYGYMHRSVRKEFLALLCGTLCGQGRPGRGSAAESCFAVTDGRSAHTRPPGRTTRVRPLHTWEEGTTSSSPTDRRSRESHKETTSVILLDFFTFNTHQYTQY